MQSIEALETIFTSEVNLLHAFSTSDLINIDHENQTISLTYNYNKDNIETEITRINNIIDSYVSVYQDEGDIQYLKDFIKWLRNTSEQITLLKETL